jgi:hypothetical protein
MEARDERRARDRDRVAIVAGLRTPFTQAGTALAAMRTVETRRGVGEGADAAQRSRAEVGGLCPYGQMVPSLDWLNIAREVVLRAGLPKEIEAYSVSRSSGVEPGKSGVRVGVAAPSRAHPRVKPCEATRARSEAPAPALD